VTSWARRGRTAAGEGGYGACAVSSRAAFERDRVRDADLQALNYRLLRITPRRLQQEPIAVVAAVAAG